MGDADQLPSVGPGALLRDIIDSGVVTVVRENEVVVLLPDDPAGGPTAAALGAECLDYCRDLFRDVRVTVGLSTVCSGAADLSRAYHEAWRTVNAARRLQRARRWPRDPGSGMRWIVAPPADPRGTRLP